MAAYIMHFVRGAMFSPIFMCSVCYEGLRYQLISLCCELCGEPIGWLNMSRTWFDLRRMRLDGFGLRRLSVDWDPQVGIVNKDSGTQPEHGDIRQSNGHIVPGGVKQRGSLVSKPCLGGCTTKRPCCALVCCSRRGRNAAAESSFPRCRL